MNAVKKVFSHDSHSEKGNDSLSSNEAKHTTAGDSTVGNTTNTTGSNSVGTTNTTGSSHTAAGGVAEQVPLSGAHRSEDVSTAEGANSHTQGHSLSTIDPTQNENVDQDVQHLKHVTHETRQRHEIEEVERQRDLHRHEHHVQHHVQPVVDTEHKTEQHHTRVVPTTEVREQHSNTDKDAQLLASVAGGHKDQVQHAGVDHVVVDKGEKVNETVHHHIHNVIQPVIEKDTHEHHRIHTTIPTSHVLHSAPIVHDSTSHQPISKEDFLGGGGVLGAKTVHVGEAGLLNDGKCTREVDGVGERFEKELGLKQGEADRRVELGNSNAAAV